MTLSSPAFADGTPIPTKYTCDGDDISPPLEFNDVPPGATALALEVRDPDSPSGNFLHWLVTNIAPTTTKIEEGSEPTGTPHPSDFGRTGWGGPCPGRGNHRYIFTLTAKDSNETTLATAALTGTYQRQTG